MVGSAIAPVTLLYMQSMFGWRGAYVGAAIFGFIVLAVLIAQPEPMAEIAHAGRTAKGRDGTVSRVLHAFGGGRRPCERATPEGEQS